MKLNRPATVKTDVLVLGGGGAGLRAAIEAKREGARVTLLSRPRVGYGSNTAIAAGNIAAASHWRDPADSPELQLKDSVIGGRFLNDQRLLETLTNAAEQEIYNLEALGVSFRKHGDTFTVHQSSGHSRPRNVGCVEGLGIGITLPLRRHADGMGVNFIEGVLISSLLRDKNGIAGAVGFDSQGETIVISAKSVVLALGGLGQIYQRTNNAAEATGDGYALAYRAGLPLMDMEFMQFFPTGLGKHGAKLVLYDFFIAREGATIRNSLGEDILEKYNLKNPVNQTRDNMSRVIMLEILGGRDIDGCLYLDISKVRPEFLEQARAMPHLLKGVPPDETQLPVAPTAHYQMGGVRVEPSSGRTALDGLFAAGEVVGGAHGANRMPGNALMECFVMGAITGRLAAERVKEVDYPAPDESQISEEIGYLESQLASREGEPARDVRESLRKTMQYQVGVIRDQEGLSKALSEIAVLGERAKKVIVGTPQELVSAVRLRNMLLVAEMVCRAALERNESRGSHYRSDFPEENDAEWLKNIVISSQKGKMTLRRVPVEMVKISPSGQNRPQV